MPLSDRKRVRQAADVADTLARVADRLVEPATVEQMRQADPGPTAMRFDRPIVASSGTSDPTSRAALGPHDRLAGQLATFDRLLVRITTVANQMELMLLGHQAPRHANDGDRLALQRENTRPEPGCENCARTEVAKGRARWEPPDPRRSGPTTVGGRLVEPMVLCSWCVDKTGIWDRLPTEKELQLHHDGRKVPWPKDVRKPA